MANISLILWFVTQYTPANYGWIAQIAGAILGLHLVILLVTHHASLTPFGSGRKCTCGDNNETSRQNLVFGGAAAFDWGLIYWILGYLALNARITWLAPILLGYALLRTITSALQTLLFFVQTAKAPGEGPFILKAHLDGCGYTTAISPLFILFWLQKVKGFSWVVYIRDYPITLVDMVFSIPGIILLNIWTLLVRHVPTLPTIGHVDVPRGSHL